jgi:hypothetical protein
MQALRCQAATLTPISCRSSTRPPVDMEYDSPEDSVTRVWFPPHHPIRRGVWLEVTLRLLLQHVCVRG